MLLGAAVIGAVAWGVETPQSASPSGGPDQPCSGAVASEAAESALSPFYAELAKAHPTLRTSPVFRALPWQQPVADGSRLAFRTEDIAFGKTKASAWNLLVLPSGHISIDLVLAPEDGPDGITERLVGFAQDTVDASLTEPGYDGSGKVVVSIFNMNDTDMGPVRGACRNGRGLFVTRLYEATTGTSPEAALSGATKPHPGARYLASVVDGNLQFGTRLGKALATVALREKKNFFFSPTSIGTCWGMAATGAKGPTLEQMLGVYGGSLNDRERLEGLGALAQLLKNGSTGAVNTANGLWVNHNVELVPGFATRLLEILGAQVSVMDFGAPQTLSDINGFVRKLTMGMIPALLDTLDKDGVTMLVNAVALKVKWAENFDQRATRPASFQTLEGAKNVAMMHREASYPYFVNDKVQGVSLPTEGGRIAVDFFLPNRPLDESELGALVDLPTVAQWGQGFKEKKRLKLGMPKLKLKYQQNLIPAMQALGVTAPFSRRHADFSRLSTTESFISLFLHEAVLELDEEGAKAAAATAIGNLRGVSVTPSLLFHRPYVVAFRDLTTGEVLFFGIVVDPS
jgi:serpin B